MWEDGSFTKRGLVKPFTLSSSACGICDLFPPCDATENAGPPSHYQGAPPPELTLALLYFFLVGENPGVPWGPLALSSWRGGGPFLTLCCLAVLTRAIWDPRLGVGRSRGRRGADTPVPLAGECLPGRLTHVACLPTRGDAGALVQEPTPSKAPCAEPPCPGRGRSPACSPGPV